MMLFCNSNNVDAFDLKGEDYMNLSKLLFRTSKNIIKSTGKSIKKSFSDNSKRKNCYSSSVDADDDEIDPYEDFEQNHEKECYKYENKIWNVKTDGIDPEKNIEGFKKKMLIAKELEEFCLGFGAAGKEYFDINYSDIYKDIQNDLNEYMSDQYEEDKEYFEEYKAEQKAIRKASSFITKCISKNNGSMLQKELRRDAPEEIKKYFDKAVKKLLESGKIQRIKEGNYVRLETK